MDIFTFEHTVKQHSTHVHPNYLHYPQQSGVCGHIYREVTTSTAVSGSSAVT